MHILITGGGSGIGEGLATELAKADHHIVVTDRDVSSAERVARAVRDSGGSALAVALDVSDDDAAAAAVRHLPQPVDVLINNAGLQHVARLERFPMNRWNHLIQVMLVGAARVTQAVLPSMRERGFGRVVNIGSIHSLVASPYKTAYVAAKHGLLGLSKVLALETANTDITINTICPTYVRTPLVEAQIEAQARENGISEERVIDDIMLAPMPKGVFISFEELAGITTFLMSPAARNITGQAITVDGGWTIR